MRSRVQIAIAGAMATALVVIGIVIWIDRMQPVMISISTPSTESIRVSVSGAVASPGVVDMPLGARLQDVVDAAGGFTDDADTDVLNLAGRVGDGEQVDIPAIGASPTAPAETPSTGGPIDLNTASIADLDQLPGIGEVLAGRIVEYREANGPFTSVDQLSNVDGISPRLVDEIRPFVTVSGGG